MEGNDFVVIAVLRETRDKLKVLAKQHRTAIYQLIQTFAEEDEKIFLSNAINNDNTGKNKGESK